MITKEAFEDFVKKEFPDKEFHWDYKDGHGYMSIQAGSGKKFSFPETHYEYYNGQVRLHIEGENWWWIRQELYSLLKRHKEIKGEVWQKRQNCQWVLEAQENDIFNLFKRIRNIIEPELIAYENGEIIQSNNAESVTYSEYNANKIYTLNLNIPKYQRIYTWGYEQVKTLLDDISHITLDSYFVGAVILHMREDNGNDIYDIVDGQQRIVTTALIKYALLEDKNNIPEELNRFLSCEFSSLDAQINISNNLKIINDYLADENRKSRIESNISKLTFSVLTIKNAEDLDLAFTFFSNTNSKGKKLTDYDLLKPHHLRYIPSDLEDQQMHLATKWDDMINKARSVHKDSDLYNDEREYISYIRLMELMLFRLRNWEQMQETDESEDYHIKKEFVAAPTISEIPPFGEQFDFGEPIQGGQHFFAYVDHFMDEYNKFGMKDEDGNYGLKHIIQNYFGKYGSNSWYGTVIEALVFCYFLKFGNNYIYEATISIVRYISIIRFIKGRAYKKTINEWARKSKIVLEISKATSPTFFLATTEKLIDKALSENYEKEDASTGVRWTYLNYCCKGITENLIKKSKVQYYKNYYKDRYGMLG